MAMKPSRSAGFTLLEISTVMAVLLALAAFSIQRFNVSNSRTKRTEARTILANIWQQQEIYRGNTGMYASSLSMLDLGLPLTAEGWGQGAYYTFVLSSTDGYATHFRCEGAGNLDDDPWLDVLRIDGGRPVE